MSDSEVLQCGGVQNEDVSLNLRIASIFVILVASTFGACFPLWAKQKTIIPKGVFQYVHPSNASGAPLESDIPIALSLGLPNTLAQASS
jgi:hypothetical protein